MKTATQKSFVFFSLLTLLIFGVSMNSFAASAAEHGALANQFESLAKEMQAKVEEISHKPRSSYFGKNARRNKSHAANKIHKYEKAIEEYAEKAIYHRKIAAGQANEKSAANVNQNNEATNKAKKKSNSHDSL